MLPFSSTREEIILSLATGVVIAIIVLGVGIVIGRYIRGRGGAAETSAAGTPAAGTPAAAEKRCWTMGISLSWL